jgi:hypothetical protein
MRQASPPAYIMMGAASNSPILMMSPGANPELSNIGRITSAWLGRGSCGHADGPLRGDFCFWFIFCEKGVDGLE